MNSFDDKLFEVVKDVEEVKQAVDEIKNSNTITAAVKKTQTLQVGNTYVLLTELVSGHMFEGVVRYNYGNCYLNITLIQDSDDIWHVFGSLSAEEGILNEVKISFVSVMVEEKEYLALKLYLETYDSLSIEAWCVSSTNPEIFELITDGISNEQAVDSSKLAPLIDQSELKTLEDTVRINGYNNSGLNGPASNKYTVVLADIEDDSLVRQFNLRTTVKNDDTSKLMGEAIVAGCIYNGNVTITQCDFIYTDDRDDLVFKIGKLSNKLMLYPSFTNLEKSVSIMASGCSKSNPYGSSYGDSFEEIDVTSIDLASKIAALEARVAALESPSE